MTEHNKRLEELERSTRKRDDNRLLAAGLFTGLLYGTLFGIQLAEAKASKDGRRSRELTRLSELDRQIQELELSARVFAERQGIGAEEMESLVEEAHRRSFEERYGHATS